MKNGRGEQHPVAAVSEYNFQTFATYNPDQYDVLKTHIHQYIIGGGNVPERIRSRTAHVKNYINGFNGLYNNKFPCDGTTEDKEYAMAIQRIVGAVNERVIADQTNDSTKLEEKARLRLEAPSITKKIVLTALEQVLEENERLKITLNRYADSSQTFGL